MKYPINRWMELRQAVGKAHAQQLVASPFWWDKVKDAGLPRAWWANLQGHPVHPAVFAMLQRGYDAPWMAKLVLEHPTVSADGRLAYTQTEAKGRAEIRTVTTAGRYLRRTFPDAPDHVIRDVVLVHENESKCQITTDMDEILDVVTNEAVYSCMCNHSHYRHPYRCYSERLGWGLAFRGTVQEPQARALVHISTKHYVRSFTLGRSSSRGGDAALEAWLEDQGYSKQDCWSGKKLEKIELANGWLAPYLDGDVSTVREQETTWLVTESGNFDFCNQDGTADPGHQCDNCGAACDEEAFQSVGYNGNSQCCPNCQSDFTMVTGRRGHTYLVPEGDAVWVEGEDEYYDKDFLDYHGIVRVDCGDKKNDYYKRDDLVETIDGDYWHEDDVTNEPNDRDTVILIEAGQHEGEYERGDYTFRCHHDGKIYHDDDGYEHRELNGENVTVADCNTEAWDEDHPEEAEEEAEEDAEEAQEVTT